jgi:hypothetical protein
VRGQGVPYVALAVVDDAGLGPTGGRVGVELRIAPALQRELGNEVLLYRPGTAEVSFFAQARLSGLHAPRVGSRECDLEDLTWFPTPVAGPTEAVMPGVRRMLNLGQARFVQILAAARRGAADAAEEATVVPALDAPVPIEQFLRVHNEVMARWQYRCAVTDVQFAPSEGLHPHLRLVAIRPRRLGGPLSSENFLPMVELAEHAWVTGVISAGPALDLLVVPNRLDPSLLEAMPPDGKLIVPEDPASRPNPAHLAFHRTRIFAEFG